MKITYLHQYFTTPQEAGGIRSYEMARRLVAAGHDVTMITSRRTGLASGTWEVTHEAGITVHWLPLPYSNRLSYPDRIKAFIEFARASALRAAAIPADVVFATSTPLTIALPAVYAAKRQRAPMVFEVRDLWPEVPIAVGALRGAPLITAARALEQFAYRNAEAVVALSPGMKAGVVAAGYPAHQVAVIPNSCDLEIFQGAEAAGQAFRARYPWLQDRPMVLYAGTLGRINGTGYMAEIAAAMLPLNPEVRFVLVGDGVERDEVEARARTLGVLDRTLFLLPPLPKNEIPAAFAAADISTSFVIDLKELWPNSANKFFDTLASGTCMVINHQGWQADLLRESGAGFVLPPSDARVAAALLAQVLAAPAFLQQAGAAALHLARTRFDRALLAQQLEQVLRSAFDSYRSRHAPTSPARSL